MYYVYVLRSLKDNKRYIGFTKNLEKRLERHNSGKVISTRHRCPFVIEHQEQTSSRKEAARREIEIKKMKGGIQFQQLLKCAGVVQW